jgi:hypothetical protein
VEAARARARAASLILAVVRPRQLPAQLHLVSPVRKKRGRHPCDVQGVGEKSAGKPRRQVFRLCPPSEPPLILEFCRIRPYLRARTGPEAFATLLRIRRVNCRTFAPFEPLTRLDSPRGAREDPTLRFSVLFQLHLYFKLLATSGFARRCSVFCVSLSRFVMLVVSVSG